MSNWPAGVLELPQAVLYTIIVVDVLADDGGIPRLEQIARSYTLEAEFEGLFWIHGHHSEDSETGAALLATFQLVRSVEP